MVTLAASEFTTAGVARASNAALAYHTFRLRLTTLFRRCVGLTPAAAAAYKGDGVGRVEAVAPVDEQESSLEQRRRSPRQETAISVHVRGQLRDGRGLEEVATVDQLSSHGIRLRMEAALPNGSEVEVVVSEGRPAARYRVVWGIEDAERGGWQMGLELVKGAEGSPGTAAAETGSRWD